MNGFLAICRVIDAINEVIGRAVTWLILVMVGVQFVVVVMRYVFGVGSIFLQEAIMYLFAMQFLAAVGYTLLHDDHVRIDVFYGRMRTKQKAIINLVGTFVFLFPFTVVVFWNSLPFVLGSWRSLEGSTSVSGIQAVYLLKSFIIVFSVLLFIQGVSLALRCVLHLTGRSVLADDRDAL